ncbi:GAF domain-containing protein, partial [Enterococcus faecium]|uniref:GAF domain-containing protein n=1 Tax=Enterococcus faecium TaxID=1352 RepID=UPI003DA1A2CC
VLATLCRTIEEQAPDLLCSVLLLDDDGQHLRVGAGPGLPDAYVRHLDGLGIDPPYHGPCGMALHTGQAVVVTDARTDGRWPAAWRELVAGHG